MSMERSRHWIRMSCWRGKKLDLFEEVEARSPASSSGGSLGGFLVPSWIFHLLGLFTFCSSPEAQPRARGSTGVTLPTDFAQGHQHGSSTRGGDSGVTSGWCGMSFPAMGHVPGGAGLDVAEEMMKPPWLAAGPQNCPTVHPSCPLLGTPALGVSLHLLG